MAGYETLSLKLTENLTLAEIDERAEKLNMNRSQFVNMALQMVTSFDLDFWNRIQKYSDGLHIPEWAIIQNMLIDRFAREEAWMAVFGKPNSKIDDFIFFNTPDGPALLTGSEFAEIKYEHYTRQFEAELFKKAIAKQKAGRQLTDREAAIIKKFKSLEGYPGEYEDRIEEELNED